MKRFAALAVMPLFAGFLIAQDTSTTETRTTTTKTTWNGTLVDAGCQTTHTEHKQTSSSTNPEDKTVTTRTETSHSESTDCPVTTTTTSFGLMTSDGKFVRFDQPSNTRIVEMVKTNKTWGRDINDHAPIRVRVVGTPSGDVVVMESIR